MNIANVPSFDGTINYKLRVHFLVSHGEHFGNGTENRGNTHERIAGVAACLCFVCFSPLPDSPEPSFASHWKPLALAVAASVGADVAVASTTTTAAATAAAISAD